jgi:tetratricopeptide (TPR) repeat protein
MREALLRAREDARKAQSVRHRLVLARSVESDVEFLLGNRDRAEALMESALVACPSCYGPRVSWLSWLEPRWGGSLEEMQRYAARGQRDNPRHRKLPRVVDFERMREADAAGRKDEVSALVAHACATGEDLGAFLDTCVGEKVDRKDLAGAVSLLDHALERRAGSPGLRLDRAWYLARLNRWEDAGRDLLYAVRCEPTSGRILLRQVVPALDALGWKAHLAGRKEDALRLYALAMDLSPANLELANRAEKARAAGGRPVEPSGRDPLAGDGRPELRVTVRDRTGHPVAGASVVPYLGTLPGERIARALRTDPAAELTDGAGQLRAPVQAGDRTVVVWLPGGKRGIVAWIHVPITGEDLTVTVDAAGRLAGRVVDTATPPAPLGGAEILVLPEASEPGRTRAIGSALSSADGSFVIEGLDEGSYRVFPARENYHAAERGAALRQGQPRIDLQLQRMQTLSGRVLVADQGRPPSPAAQVLISSPGIGKRTLTTVEGRFSLYFMGPDPAAQVAFSVEGRAPVVRALNLTHLDNDAGDVVIGGGRLVRGQVVAQDGAPIRGAVVSSPAGQRLAETVIDGSFQASVQDGPVELAVGHPDWLPARRLVGAGEDRVTIALLPGGRFQVLVVDEDGSPVGEARLRSTNGGATCVTEASGRCELRGIGDELECIQLVTHPRLEGLQPPVLCVPTTPGATRPVVLRSPRSRTRVTARVLDAGGKPIDEEVRAYVGADAFPAAVSPQGTPRLPFHWFRSARPLEDLSHGRYLLVARTWAGACAATAVDLRTVNEATATLTLGDGSCSR